VDRPFKRRAKAFCAKRWVGPVYYAHLQYGVGCDKVKNEQVGCKIVGPGRGLVFQRLLLFPKKFLHFRIFQCELNFKQKNESITLI
jgi:hypothetical protein